MDGNATWVPGDLSPENDHHREVYAYYGLAMYRAQVLEHELVNFVFVSRTTSGQVAGDEQREALSQALFAATMGKQLREALAETRLSLGQVELLESALSARNFLAHNYFRERIAKFATVRGRNEMLEELDALRETFEAADAALSPITLELMARGGVTSEMIAAAVARRREEAIVKDILIDAAMAAFMAAADNGADEAPSAPPSV